MSAVGLLGALGVLTGGSAVLVLGLHGGLHVLTRAERARNPDEQAAAPTPKPPGQVLPQQVPPCR
jgi:hypothetical protein